MKLSLQQFLFFLLAITIYCFPFVLIERKGTHYCIFSHFNLVYMVLHLFSQYITLRWNSTLQPSIRFPEEKFSTAAI